MQMELNKTLLRKFVRKLEDMDPAPVHPSGMSQKDTELMVKVLSAKCMDDIADVSLQEITKLFEFTDVFAAFIDHHDCFTGQYGDFEKNLLSMPSISARRIL